uniref:Serine/threonine protein kinase n=1 Tax=uncultured Thiotrichaceae bacterium TaxID=298394 RepID=A0A6S6U2G4_9GAMM|nr:MAG: Serine/threonine protein kinase [uncultured Thiotrichaceae bacterium]
MGNQLSADIFTNAADASGGFLLVEGDSPLRLDLIATLRELFPTVPITYLCKSDVNDLREVQWDQFELVLLGSSSQVDESLSWLDDQGFQKAGLSFPLVVMLTDGPPQRVDVGLPVNADMRLPYDVSVSDFAEQIDIARETQRLLSEYPMHLPGWYMRAVLHNSENAVIFLAEDHLGYQVAVKRFKFDVSQISDGALDDFMNEAYTLMLQHNVPVLVKLLDAGVTIEAAYLIMEYLPGVTLKDRLQVGLDEVGLDKRLKWFRQVVEALSVIHESGVLHRDLKSSNVLMREDDSPAVLDLGVESRLLSDCGFLNADEIYCTPFYVSPERIIGEPASVASDLYALGILFYEMLTGDKPFLGDNLGDVLTGHMFNQVPPLPDHLVVYQPLLSQLLIKSPEFRPESARLVLSQLDELSD